MLTNDEMKAGRFLKIHKGRKRFNAIQSHLASGGSVLVGTATKSTKFQPKHSDMIRIGKSGSVYVQRGKSWDCIDFAGVAMI